MAFKVVTVFGGTGFIGRHLIWRLARAGVRVRVATRDAEKVKVLMPAGDPGQVMPVLCSIGNDASVAAAVRGSDAVINLIGILHETKRRSFMSVHRDAAARIARLSAAAGVARVVHVSALGASSASSSAYQRSKAAGEQAVLDAFPGATILRPSVIFGPGDGLFSRFARLARWLPALPLVGGGKTRFQPVYVGDVADAIMAVLDRPETRGRTFELGGLQVMTLREIMQRTLTETHRRKPLIPLPWGLAKLKAAVLERLPGKMLTRDQVESLKTDNVVGTTARGLRDLGLEPTAMDLVLPTYLELYRPRGRFAKSGGATQVQGPGTTMGAQSIGGV